MFTTNDLKLVNSKLYYSKFLAVKYSAIGCKNLSNCSDTWDIANNCKLDVIIYSVDWFFAAADSVYSA